MKNTASRLAARATAGVALALVLAPAPAGADPPASPPPCNVTLDPLFCIRVTDFERVPEDGALETSNRWRIMFEYLNWTGKDAYGLVMTVNNGSTKGAMGMAPFFADISVDSNGTPFGPAPLDGVSPLTGNQDVVNTWVPINLSPSMACFFWNGGLPLKHPSALGFDGLLDPSFASTSQGTCLQALNQMIPMSQIQGAHIQINDHETVDDGTNVLDGFVIEVDELDVGEQFSFDWFLIELDGSLIGMPTPPGGPVGTSDDFGFGTFNLTILPQLASGTDAPGCLLYTSPSPRDQRGSRMPSSA